ncbi:hypothetical protein KCG43_20165 [Photobacterium sp. WH24]|uniref:hypothetical protein n=1 Tax=Photobacterium sp. WH24 TaxID=2827237 RepID=UPI001C43B108|nr:hypothetical protein [Photobacterium sp. WH24]MBV7264330.1 hypothetical protein [Photobacterium sp. WH24]
MSWANCGQDSQGRYIGYAIDAVCDHPGCNKEIHRGLTYVCGDMHGDDEHSCERYFCEEHKNHYVVTNDNRGLCVCDQCASELLESGEWAVNDDDELVRKPE